MAVSIRKIKVYARLTGIIILGLVFLAFIASNRDPVKTHPPRTQSPGRTGRPGSDKDET